MGWSIRQMMAAGQGGDLDYWNFIGATKITDTTIKGGISTLISSAKLNGWWAKCFAIYLFVSDGIYQTRAFQFKFNLKNPTDSDLAFRLTINGGTSSSSGWLPNGTSDYCETHFIPSLSGWLQNSAHVSMYCNADAQS